MVHIIEVHVVFAVCTSMNVEPPRDGFHRCSFPPAPAGRPSVVLRDASPGGTAGSTLPTPLAIAARLSRRGCRRPYACGIIVLLAVWPGWIRTIVLLVRYAKMSTRQRPGPCSFCSRKVFLRCCRDTGVLPSAVRRKVLRAACCGLGAGALRERAGCRGARCAVVSGSSDVNILIFCLITCFDSQRCRGTATRADVWLGIWSTPSSLCSCVCPDGSGMFEHAHTVDNCTHVQKSAHCQRTTVSHTGQLGHVCVWPIIWGDGIFSM